MGEASIRSFCAVFATVFVFVSESTAKLELLDQARQAWTFWVPRARDSSTIFSLNCAH